MISIYLLIALVWGFAAGVVCSCWLVVRYLGDLHQRIVGLATRLGELETKPGAMLPTRAQLQRLHEAIYSDTIDLWEDLDPDEAVKH